MKNNIKTIRTSMKNLLRKFTDRNFNKEKMKAKLKENLSKGIESIVSNDKLISFRIAVQKNFNKLQDKVEISFKKIAFDESLLKQSDFWLKSVTWALIGTSSFAFIWLCFAKTDEVVVAIGKLEPKGDVKEIQIPIGGVIEEILVESGDRVIKNQILVQLDKETSIEEYNSLEFSLEKKELQLQKNQSILDLKKTQKNQEFQLIREQIKSLKDKRDINVYLLSRMKNLYEEGGISQFQYLEQQIKHNEIISQLSQLKIEEFRKSNILNQEIEQLESDQARIGSEIANLKAKLIAAKVTLKYQSLKSPVAGIVFDLKPTTEGYVAQSSEPIMKIVPFDELEADIEIPSNKIGFVKVDMPVEISIDSFPSSDFGILEGKVFKIGSDALPPSQLEQRTEYKYPATIKLSDQSLKLEDGSSLPLQVGMSLTANIKLRKVSYLQLLFNTFEKKTDALKKI